MAMRIVQDDLTQPDVIALVTLHLQEAHANSPPGSVFALDLTGLRDPAVTVWSAWDGETLAGICGLKQLDAVHGELKSMRTAPSQIRRGVGQAMLDHLIAEAKARGYRRVSLETGRHGPYAPARALYERSGFVACGPFGAYRDVSFSRYYTLEF